MVGQRRKWLAEEEWDWNWEGRHDIPRCDLKRTMTVVRRIAGSRLLGCGGRGWRGFRGSGGGLLLLLWVWYLRTVSLLLGGLGVALWEV